MDDSLQMKKLRQLLKMTQKEFGSRLDVSRDVIANIECGRVKPQKMFLQHICDTFCVNPDWLANGRGPVFFEMDQRTKEAIQLFQSLHPDLQRYALKQMDMLLELQKKHL